jgi:hypothetical protein
VKRGRRPDNGRSTRRLSEAALAGHSGTTADRDLRTETGEAGGNPKAGRRRGAKAWHPNRAGALYPASGDAGSGAHKFYELIGDGRVTTTTIGRRRLVIVQSLFALVGVSATPADRG